MKGGHIAFKSPGHKETGVFRQGPKALFVQVVVVVMGDYHVHPAGKFPEFAGLKRGRGDPLGEKGTVGKHGVREPVFPLEAHQEAAMADPGDKICIGRCGLDSIFQVRDDLCPEGALFVRVFGLF